MKRTKHWLTAVGGALVLLLSYPSGSSQSSPVTDLPVAPSAEELQMVEELADWVGGRGGTGGFEILEEGVAGLIRDRRRSFELFRQYNDGETRRRLLDSKPFGDVIAMVAGELRLDSLLLSAVVQAESSYDPTVVSERGALGLMQLMPGTAAQYGASNPMDPRLNVRAGARYLRHLLDLYQGDLELALAAYNAGPGNVRRHGGVPPFVETNRYVEKVLSAYVASHRLLWQGLDIGELLDQVSPVASG